MHLLIGAFYLTSSNEPELNQSEQAAKHLHAELDGCIVSNAHNTVFGSKRSAICMTVELLYNVFFKLNDLHISTSVPAT